MMPSETIVATTTRARRLDGVGTPGETPCTTPQDGVSDSHHPLSHHQNEAAKLERLHLINEYHLRQFAHLVRRLAETPEADGTLLDRTLLVYGTGISDSNTHFHDDLPIALVGGGVALLGSCSQFGYRLLLRVEAHIRSEHDEDGSDDDGDDGRWCTNPAPPMGTAEISGRCDSRTSTILA